MTIVSFKHRFIFIKTRKTASTSVEGFLRNICSREDIVTPVSPDDEFQLVIKGLYPRNYSNDKEGESFYISLIREKKFKEAQIHLKRMKRSFRNHMSLDLVRKRLRKPIFFRRAHKVTVERHPFGFFLSRVAYDLRKRSSVNPIQNDLEELRNAVRYLCKNANINPEMIPRNWDMYARGDKILVDRVLRYEFLKEDLNDFVSDLGIGMDIDLPHMKAIGAGSEQNFSLIDPDCKELIRSRFKETFLAFGYDENA